METLARAFQDDHERVPPESSRSQLPKNHGRTTRAVFLRRRRQTPRRLRRAKSQRLSAARFFLSPVSSRLFYLAPRFPFAASRDAPPEIAARIGTAISSALRAMQLPHALQNPPA